MPWYLEDIMAGTKKVQIFCIKNPKIVVLQFEAVISLFQTLTLELRTKGLFDDF